MIQLGKWHFKLGLIPVYWMSNGMMFHFGIFKPIKHPPEGCIWDSSCYRGFWFRKEFEFTGLEITN